MTQEVAAPVTNEIISQIEHVLITDHQGKQSGDRIMARCATPSHDDHNPSMSWSRSKHVWKCFSCGAGGGWVDLAKLLQLELPNREKPVWRNAGRWEIKNIEGVLLGVHVRQELPNGDKRFRWEGHNGRSSKDMPLYGSELIPKFDKMQPVFITEGAGKCDVLRTLGVQAVATVTGASATPSRNVLSVLDGFDVCLWPDNDDPGRSHMGRVAERLSEEPLWLTWPDAPIKGDAADFIEQGGTSEQLSQLHSLATSPPENSQSPSDTPGSDVLPSFPLYRKEGSTSGLRLQSFAELLANPLPKVDFLWDQQLGLGQMSALLARPKAGKSHTALNLVESVISGNPFLGYPTTKSNVAYLALEGSQTEVLRQLQSLGISTDAPIDLHFGSLHAKDPVETAEILHQVIERSKAKLVVVDTLARMWPYVQDLNDYAQVTRAFAPCEQVARVSGAHIAWLHHAPKGDGGGDGEIPSLGSTAVTAVPDTIIGITRTKDNTRIIRTQQRYGVDLEPIVLNMDESGRITSGGSVEEASKRRALDSMMEIVEDEGEISASDLATKVGGNTSYYYDALRLAKSSGWLNTRKQGRTTFYSRNNFGNDVEVR